MAAEFDNSFMSAESSDSFVASAIDGVSPTPQTIAPIANSKNNKGPHMETFAVILYPKVLLKVVTDDIIGKPFPILIIFIRTH